MLREILLVVNHTFELNWLGSSVTQLFRHKRWTAGINRVLLISEISMNSLQSVENSYVS